MRRSSLFIPAIVILTAACTRTVQPLPEIQTTRIPQISPSSSSPIRLEASAPLPSQTHTQARTSEVRPLPPPTNTPEPAPTPAGTTLPDPLFLVPPDSGLQPGPLNDLWIGPQGELWVATQTGLYRQAEPGLFEEVFGEPVDRVLGLDGAGRIWVLLWGEEDIAVFENNRWTVYAPENGWQKPAGMEPGGTSFGDNLATGPDGQVWLATGRDDLRRFNPRTGRWMRLTAAHLGFSPADPEYQGHFLTDTVVSQTGSVWVAGCTGEGDFYNGQGVRFYKDDAWGSVPKTKGQCVLDLEIDFLGQVWVGAFDKLIRYNALQGIWTEIPLPAWDRLQLVAEIELDPLGNPWVEIIRCGGASCSMRAYYAWIAGEWIPYVETGELLETDMELAFAVDGEAWLCYSGTLYRRADRQNIPIAPLPGGQNCRLAVDGDGQVWVGDSSGLYWVNLK